MLRVLPAVAAALLLVSCGGASVESTVGTAPVTTAPVTAGPAPTSPLTTSPVTTSPVTTSPVTDVPIELSAFATTTILIDDVAHAVAVADSPSERARGLMGVEDLEGLAGMLFVFETEGFATFWMKNTPIPLDIAFFDADGGYVDDLTMEPCAEESCPSYSAEGTFQYAVEVPAGGFDWLSGDEHLAVPDL